MFHRKFLKNHAAEHNNANKHVTLILPQTSNNMNKINNRTLSKYDFSKQLGRNKKQHIKIQKIITVQKKLLDQKNVVW